MGIAVTRRRSVTRRGQHSQAEPPSRSTEAGDEKKVPTSHLQTWPAQAAASRNQRPLKCSIRCSSWCLRIECFVPDKPGGRKKISTREKKSLKNSDNPRNRISEDDHETTGDMAACSQSQRFCEVFHRLGGDGLLGRGTRATKTSGLTPHSTPPPLLHSIIRAYLSISTWMVSCNLPRGSISPRVTLCVSCNKSIPPQPLSTPAAQRDCHTTPLPPPLAFPARWR